MKKSFGARTMLFALPVWCVGSYDAEGNANVMTVAWGGICCSKPPCVTISLRKATYTYGNIMKRRAYTVSLPSEQYARQADYFGMVSGREVDKFQVSGLTPVRSELVDAPYVGEFPVVLECRVIHHHEIGLHTQFIGEILDVKIDEEVLDSANRPDVGRIRPFVYGTSPEYYYRVGEAIGQAFQIGREV
jgi:flavin reductase (DIM6/NTAB) family NADH-FMN oxidoreductase RutF